MLVTILSFSTAGIEQVKTDVALHMLRVWKRGSREANYGGLCNQLKASQCLM